MNTKGNVVAFEGKEQREIRKTLNVISNVLKAIKNNKLNYLMLCASINRPDEKSNEVHMTYQMINKMGEEELQAMIDFIQDGADDLIKVYFTSSS